MQPGTHALCREQLAEGVESLAVLGRQQGVELRGALEDRLPHATSMLAGDACEQRETVA